jgi:hypothetical protein
MSRLLARSIGAALLGLTASTTAALAQDAPAPAPSAAPAAAPAAPAPAAPAPSGTAAPSSGPSNLGGYGGPRRLPPPGASDAPRHHGLLAHHANEAVAKLTGFEMLADGGSRLFVQLSKQVDVEPEKLGGGGGRKGKKGKLEAQVVSRMKFVLKGAEIVNPMNEGALVTVHFNTPLVRSKLMPAGRNLALVVELRADVQPDVKFVATKDNGSMLQIDFPQGTYLPPGGDSTDPSAPPPGASAKETGGMPGNMPSSSAPTAGGTDKADSN